MLYTLGQLANEFPEVSETLAIRLQEADLRLPVKPPSRAPGKGSMGSTAIAPKTFDVQF